MLFTSSHLQSKDSRSGSANNSANQCVCFAKIEAPRRTLHRAIRLMMSISGGDSNSEWTIYFDPRLASFRPIASAHRFGPSLRHIAALHHSTGQFCPSFARFRLSDLNPKHVPFVINVAIRWARISLDAFLAEN